MPNAVPKAAPSMKMKSPRRNRRIGRHTPRFDGASIAGRRRA
jgi:hypothetical protein